MVSFNNRALVRKFDKKNQLKFQDHVRELGSHNLNILNPYKKRL